jgi:hypothetical protein
MIANDTSFWCVLVLRILIVDSLKMLSLEYTYKL